MHGLGIKFYALGLSFLAVTALSLVLLVKIPDPPPADPSDQAYRSILKLMGQRDYRAAIRQCQQLIVRQPDYYRAYRKLAEASQAAGQLDRAADFLQQRQRLRPEHACAYYGLGAVYREKKDYPQARTWLQQAAWRAPAFADAVSLLVITYQDLKKGDEAVGYLSDRIKNDPGNAYLHYGLGYAYRRLTAWDQGRAHLAQALALKPDLLEAIMMRAEIAYYQGQYKEAIAIYEQALRVAERKNDWENQGRIILNIGISYQDTGEYARAASRFYQSQKIFRGLGNRSQEAQTLLYIGLAHYYLGDSAQALDHVQAAGRLHQALNNPRGQADCLKVTAAIYGQEDNPRTALENYQRALQIYQDLPDRFGQADILNNMGNVYRDLGDAMKARDHYQRALDLYQELGNRANWGQCLINMGIVYRHFGDFQRALDYLQRALAIHQESGNRRAEANTLSNIALVHEDLGAYGRALGYRQNALALFEKLGNRRGVADMLNGIGCVYGKTDRDAEALAHFQRAYDIHRQAHYRQGEGLALTNLGSTYTRLGKIAQALECQQAALRLGSERNHQHTIWLAAAGLARALEQQGQLERAREQYQQAIAVIEKIRGQLETGEQKAGYMQNKLDVYEHAVGLLLKLHERDPGRGYDQEAFDYAERAHARALLETLAEARVNLQSQIGADQRERQRKIYDEMARLQREIMQDEAASSEQRSQRLAQLREREQKWEDFIIDLRRSHARYAQLQYPQPYRLARVQQEVMRPGQMLLEYLLGDERSYLFAVRKDHFAVTILPGRSEIEAAVKPYLALIGENPQQRGRQMDQAFAQTYRQGYKLYRMLLKGVDPSASARWIIVADGVLHYLPFEALAKEGRGALSEAGSEGGNPLRYLAEDFTITYVPSASVLGEIRRDEPPGPENRTARTLLALADPVFPSAYAMGRSLRPLPHSRAEAEAIAEMYPGDDRKICVGEQARESVIKNEAARYRAIHLATHGWIDDAVPARSAILLAGDAEDDGLLQMREIYDLKLNADLVVLSACQTGLGKAIRGEGLMGMTRAFLYAGTRSVVVSLWNVPDETTARLMEQFYRQLWAPKSKGEALQNGKREMIRSERRIWRHPYFWAGFVLVGSGG